MDFVEHARANGLIMTHAIADSRWHRVKTTDKPNKRNGAYIFDGVRGYRDWETDRKSTRLNSSHLKLSRMPSSA